MNPFETVFCPECRTEMQFIGQYSCRMYGLRVFWSEWKCDECGYLESDEPDFN